MKKYLSVVAALVLATLCTPAAFAAEIESECAKNEAAWLQANADRLPKSLEDMKAIPEEEQKIAFRNLDAGTQSAIWESHYQEVLTTRGGEMSAEQRAVIEKAIEASTPELYSLRENDLGFAAAQAKLREAVAEAKNVFSAEDVHAIFFTLGLQNEAQSTKMPTQGLANCDCSSNYDCGGGMCRRVLCVAVQGCGPGYTQGCWGRC